MVCSRISATPWRPKTTLLRRSRRLRLTDVPRLVIGGGVQFASLFNGRYQRTEGAHVLVRDEEGRYLVVRTTYLGPGWMLPGGRVERDEPPHVAASREVREETGMEVQVDRLALIDARTANSVSFVFHGRAKGGTLEPQFGEIAEVAWVERDEIARTSPRLHQLLQLIERDEPTVVYLELGDPPA